MNGESGFDEPTGLATAFGDVVGDVVVGPSPTAAVMADGRSLRMRRRAVFGAGFAVLAVMPVAAVAAFGTVGAWLASAASSTATSKAESKPYPLGPGDQVKVVLDGTYKGTHWLIVRDRYTLNAKEAAPADPMLRPHRPLADVAKPGAVYCERTALLFDGQDLNGTLYDFLGCDVAQSDQPEDATGPYLKKPDYYNGYYNLPRDSKGPSGRVFFGTVTDPRVDAVSLTGAFGDEPVTPLKRDGTEPVGYYAWMIDRRSGPVSVGQGAAMLHYFDAQGQEIGTSDVIGMFPPPPVQSPTAGK